MPGPHRKFSRASAKILDLVLSIGVEWFKGFSFFCSLPYTLGVLGTTSILFSLLIISPLSRPLSLLVSPFPSPRLRTFLT